MRQRLIPFLIALVGLVAAGLVHGFWSDRWRTSEELEDAARRVQDVPLSIGPWQGRLMGSSRELADAEEATIAAGNREAVKMNSAADSFAQAGAESYWMRVYTNETTRQSFLVILMCGRAGRMSVHTPEVCYQGAGYEVGADPSRVDVRDERGQTLGSFWTARFLKRQGVIKDLRLAWAWSGRDVWQAPDNPRWTFRGRPFLYKLYVSHEIPETGGSVDASALEFLRQVLPSMNEVLHK